jgi:hypothetical protein
LKIGKHAGNKMTTITIKKETYTLDNRILQDLGYILKGRVWSKKIEMPQIRNEIERLQVLKIPNIEIILD